MQSWEYFWAKTGATSPADEFWLSASLDNMLYLPENFGPTWEQPAPSPQSSGPGADTSGSCELHNPVLWLLLATDEKSGQQNLVSSWIRGPFFGTTNPEVGLYCNQGVWGVGGETRGAGKKVGLHACKRGASGPPVGLTMIINKTQTMQPRCQGVLEAPDRMKWPGHHNPPLRTLTVPTRQWGNWGKQRQMTCPCQSHSLPTSTLRVDTCPTLLLSFHLYVWKAEGHFDGKRPGHDNSLGSNRPFPKPCLEWHSSFVSPDLHSIRCFSLNWRALRRTPCCPVLNHTMTIYLPLPRGARTLLPICQPSWDKDNLLQAHPPEWAAQGPTPLTARARLPDSRCSKQAGGHLQGGLYRVRSRWSQAVARPPMTLLRLRTRPTIPNKHVPSCKMHRWLLDVYS